MGDAPVSHDAPTVVPRSGRRMECSQCLQMVPLAMPVEFDSIGGRSTEMLCLACRLGYDRHDAIYFGRAEGRHRRLHAVALPCSLQSLQWRAANVVD